MVSHTSSPLICPNTTFRQPSPALPYDLNLLGRTVIALNQTHSPHANQRSRKTSAYITDRTDCYLHCIRFTKACRQKGRWINVAICFGIDLQDIFRLGIRSEIDAEENDDDDDDEYPNMYVICAVLISLLTHHPIAQPGREDSS